MIWKRIIFLGDEVEVCMISSHEEAENVTAIERTVEEEMIRQAS